MWLSNYYLEFKIVSFASCIDTLTILRKMNHNSVLLSNRKLIFYPDEISVDISVEEYNQLKQIAEFSVLEFSNRKVRVVIDASSDENTILITNKCNSNCIMCPISDIQRKNSSVEKIENLITICKHMPTNLPHITITGGEPFILGNSIFTLFQYLKNYFGNIEYLLLTNGRIFSDNYYFKKFVESAPPKIVVGIPLHGYNESTHDMITRTKNSFKQTVSGIKKLISLDIKVEIRIVVSKINYKYLNLISKYICETFKKVYRVNFIGLEMLGNARMSINDVWIGYRESFSYIKNAIDYMICNGIDVVIYNYPLCCVENKYWSLCKKSISNYKIRYSEKCKYCSVLDACCGMFSGTYKLLEKEIHTL